MKKRILIGYVDHDICQELFANKIDKDLKNKYEVMIVNLSDYLNSSYNKFKIINKLTNSKLASLKNLKDITYSLDNKILRESLIKYKPDIIISTHFYVNYIMGYYNSNKIINATLVSFLPDFTINTWWTINKDEIDYYLVSSDKVRQDLIKSYVNSDKIITTFFPVILSENISKDILIKRYNLRNNMPIYLFFGEVEQDYDFFRDVVKRNFSLNLVFVCGNNKMLMDKCQNFIRNRNIRNVVVLSFVKDIFNIMSISDVVISRANAYTLNEIIVHKKPSILLPSLNGLERINCKYMVSKNFAVKAINPYFLSKKIDNFLKFPFIVNSMTNKLNKLDIEFKDNILEVLDIIKIKSKEK